MFHRIGAAAYKADLNNIIAISELTGNPQKQFKSVHIAGTNGKGSVSNMLASVFMEAGYKTGLFTSPHLKDFRERIRINGEMIDEENVIRFVEDYQEIFKDIQPSFFEWTTALAFSYFAKQKVDVAIIETGLGGRLDSTNIITPELSVITNISYDHMYLLGDTLEKIAIEKAGIIKQNIPVVVGERQVESEEVFTQVAKDKKSQLYFASDYYSAERKLISENDQVVELFRKGKIYIDALSLSLQGSYQKKNICTVVQSFEVLKNNFPKLDDSSFVKGVGNVRRNTGLRGRWDILNESPLTIADIAHNEAGIKISIEQLNDLLASKKNARLHMVFGMVKDKDADRILALLLKDAVYYFCQPNLPRAMDVDELISKAKVFHLKGEKYSTVAKAYESAIQNAVNDDIIYVGGSTFVVAEIIE